MSNFGIEFQNSKTNWEWKDGAYLADANSDGVEFDDEFIVPDKTIKYNYYTWTNFRILCSTNAEKINLWAQAHQYPNQLDLDGRYHQNGDAQSTYADYKTVSNIFKDSDRFYFWIKATDKDDAYSMTTTLYDPLMSTKSVNIDGDVEATADIKDIDSWLGWNPQNNSAGIPPYAFSVNSNVSEDAAHWIIGWDNTCVNVLSNVINPNLGLAYQAAILDTYTMIDGIHSQWLGCPQDRYIYGKLLYTLEYHTSIGKLIENDYNAYRLLDTIGFKSCEIAIAAIEY